MNRVRKVLIKVWPLQKVLLTSAQADEGPVHSLYHIFAGILPPPGGIQERRACLGCVAVKRHRSSGCSQGSGRRNAGGEARHAWALLDLKRDI